MDTRKVNLLGIIIKSNTLGIKVTNYAINQILK